MTPTVPEDHSSEQRAQAGIESDYPYTVIAQARVTFLAGYNPTDAQVTQVLNDVQAVIDAGGSAADVLQAIVSGLTKYGIPLLAGL